MESKLIMEVNLSANHLKDTIYPKTPNLTWLFKIIPYSNKTNPYIPLITLLAKMRIFLVPIYNKVKTLFLNLIEILMMINKFTL